MDNAKKYYLTIHTNTINFVAVSNSGYRKAYLSCYISSGKGIIDCCRGNKEKLKELNPYSFLTGDLTAYYEKAMNEVGEQVKWD